MKISVKFLLVWFLILKSHASLSQTDSSAKGKVIAERLKNKDFFDRSLYYQDLGWLSFGPSVWDNSTKKSYILQTDIFPIFPIGGARSRFNLHILPRVKIRILNDNAALGDSSWPVRTPSLMGGGLINWNIKRNSKNLHYLDFGFFHHSNGQDGNELDTKGIKFNTYNGNFSTNFLEFGYNFSKIFEGKNIVGDGKNKRDFYGKIAIQQHTGTEATLAERYGLTHINYKLGLINIKDYIDFFHDKTTKKRSSLTQKYQREQDRFVLAGSVVLGKRLDLSKMNHTNLNQLKHRINVEFTYYLKNIDIQWKNRANQSKYFAFRLPNATSLMIASGYYGSDPYNVYFEQKGYCFFRLGLGVGFFAGTGKVETNNNL